MYIDQLVYKVVIWAFFGNDFMKRGGSFKYQIILKPQCFQDGN